MPRCRDDSVNARLRDVDTWPAMAAIFGVDMKRAIQRARESTSALGLSPLALAMGGVLLSGTIQAQELTSQDDGTLSTVVVTGNRGAEQRTVTSSPVPIDVVSAKQLQNTGKPGLMEALSAVIPSLTLPEKTGWDASGRCRHPRFA